MSVRWKIFIFGILAIAVMVVIFLRPTQKNDASLVIGGRTMRVLIADDKRERTRGLSGMPSLDKDTVILFVFPESGRHGIWMKNMSFAIDILWLDEEWRIVHIEENIAPETYPVIFKPESNAKYVVEMNGGVVAQLGVRIGHLSQFKTKY